MCGAQMSSENARGVWAFGPVKRLKHGARAFVKPIGKYSRSSHARQATLTTRSLADTANSKGGSMPTLIERSRIAAVSVALLVAACSGGGGATTGPTTPDAPAQAVGVLRTGWNDIYPDVAFPYRFLDAAMGARYHRDRQTGVRFGGFGAVALALACLGLFGLVTLAARSRRKEIGIRKALGARVESIVLLLSKDFVLLIGLGFVLGVPPAAILMDDWMSGFAYSPGLSPGAFIAAGLIVSAVALATVVWQALRAATADPVKSLRYE